MPPLKMGKQRYFVDAKIKTPSGLIVYLEVKSIFTLKNNLPKNQRKVKCAVKYAQHHNKEFWLAVVIPTANTETGYVIMYYRNPSFSILPHIVESFQAMSTINLDKFKFCPNL